MLRSSFQGDNDDEEVLPADKRTSAEVPELQSFRASTPHRAVLPAQHFLELGKRLHRVGFDDAVVFFHSSLSVA